MKKYWLSTLVLVIVTFSFGFAQKTYSPFVKTSIQQKSIDELSVTIKSGLETKNFQVVGQYKPMESNDLMVVCFTRKDLQQTSLSFKDRGALASVLKIGLQKMDGGVSVSLLNPMYMFNAYFREDISSKMNELTLIDTDVKGVLTELFGKLTPFGGELTEEKLMNYHYKVMMPYFTDPEELETYASFEEGLAHIQSMIAKSGTVVKVYEQIFADKKVAVFGLAIHEQEKGEAHYLPIIGESHLAALPYEIILQGNEVTMLPGKYRIALYWPELTMGTFMKIMSTPGDIEDFFSSVTEK
ncbi:MAG: hypothetical protein JW729_06005 [Bacteroidales bacterium]|nr:hypothetical protein [Bacteroidales bacterium]